MQNISNQKRMSVSISGEIDDKIIEIRKTDAYCRCSYSEIVRQLIEAGLRAFEAEQEAG